jgi:transcriptional antiterminator RfaH
VVESLFPGYLFIRMDLQTQAVTPIRSTRGVIGMVRFGSRIPSVPEVLIERLKAAHTDLHGAIRKTPVFSPGDRVEIVSGPFTGLEAIFVSTNGEERVQILLELLGRANQVLLSPHQLVPVP